MFSPGVEPEVLLLVSESGRAIYLVYLSEYMGSHRRVAKAQTSLWMPQFAARIYNERKEVKAHTEI